MIISADVHDASVPSESPDDFERPGPTSSSAVEIAAICPTQYVVHSRQTNFAPNGFISNFRRGMWHFEKCSDTLPGIVMTSFEQLKSGETTTEQALEAFDAMDPVDVDFMIGNWKGEGFATGHALDGLLEAYHWHGKRFENPEEVHPLVFRTLLGNLTCVNPAFLAPTLAMVDRLPMPKFAAIGRVFQAMLPVFSTRKSRARLRMTTYRGVSSATMIYDQIPVNDVFRKIDDDAVFGIMDMKRMKTPFFFILRREDQKT